MQSNSSEYEGDILIVDDLADNLRVLSNALSYSGYRIRAVKTGSMALVGARAMPPDLILLDIRMPEMDGYEVCRQLKSDPQLCDIPVIFLSALDETEDKAKALQIGGADYITKPFQMEEVLVRVKNQLTIQNLKKQVAEQKYQLEQFIPSLSDSSKGKGISKVYEALVAGITTILECTDQLIQNPAINPEQRATLNIIYQNSQTLRTLVSPKDAC